MILDTVSVKHDIPGYQKLLRTRGTLVVLGLIDENCEFRVLNMLGGDRKIAGSQIGGVADTKELIKFCAEKNIQLDTELVTADKIDDVYKKLSGKNSDMIR